jgi:hypothetical protein
MRGTRLRAALAAVTVTAGASLLTVASTRSISAQAESWTPPHRMLLTPERALALMTASDRHLEYVPGEVLVRFRPGVGVAGQQRALSALRSRPSPGDLRWIAARW